MPNLIDVSEVLLKILPIIYVVDISDYRNLKCISHLNKTMRETISIFKRYYGDCDYDIRINVLSNASEGKWMYNELQPANKFEWKELCMSSESDPGSLLEELNKQLSRSEMLKSNAGFCLPYVVFISDRKYTPSVALNETIENITMTNKWFKHSHKVAIALNDEVNLDYLLQLSENPETIVPLANIQEVHEILFYSPNLDKDRLITYMKNLSISKSSQESVEDENWGDWE